MVRFKFERVSNARKIVPSQPRRRKFLRRFPDSFISTNANFNLVRQVSRAYILENRRDENFSSQSGSVHRIDEFDRDGHRLFPANTACKRVPFRRFVAEIRARAVSSER
jgi:hypothetical protein